MKKAIALSILLIGISAYAQDKETLETKLEVSAKAIQNTQAAYEKCKKIDPEEKCKSILNALETEKEVRNKLCRDNKVPSGSYGCP